jgi:formylglycine-generating enzyme required for sulfatase activity
MSLLKTLLRRSVTALFALLATAVFAGETTNRFGITMVDIPAGSFLMGNCKLTEEEKAENKRRAFLGQAPLNTNCNVGGDFNEPEAPQHLVTIKPFQMGKTEVTLGQFKQFIMSAGRKDLVTDEFMQNNRYGDNAPVTHVNWRDVQDFIKWLNSVDGGGYRLPSEAEWEYACRAGRPHNYCGDNNPDVVGWFDTDNLQPVASKRPNAWGLYDMSGNVTEVLQDCYHWNYNGAPADGSAWESGDCSKRVSRGGNRLVQFSSVLRAYDLTTERRWFVTGFRLARTPR